VVSRAPDLDEREITGVPELMAMIEKLGAQFRGRAS
jgi:hypothetical protein